ncbi:MAG TPA: nuclear transport factor 2 family protein [Albitalea sp.]|uniref:nuclear transport factor 2 family protein n=1 Tax=Piscinibacter sp. TaxID=1903157 RepID=UPI002ED0E02E
MIYRSIVERRLRRAFDALNRGDHAPVLAAFGAPVEHVFFGQHALGGARHAMASIVPWYARLKAVFPDLRFDIESVLVRGMPWNTVALIEWRDRFSLPDGTRRGNQGVHALRLKWGRVVSLRVYCDTQVLSSALRDIHAQGVTDAGLPPIVDA